MAKLTEKQELFVKEYLLDLNATQAASRAGYKKENAYAIGAENLRKPKIAEKIAEAMAERSKRTEITQDRVLQELAAIAFANGSDFAKVVDKPVFDSVNGVPVMDPVTGKQKTYKAVQLVNTEDLPEEKKKALAGIKHGKYGIEVSSCDKVKALELLGRHLGMFTEKLQVDVGNVQIVDNIPDDVLEGDQND